MIVYDHIMIICHHTCFKPLVGVSGLLFAAQFGARVGPSLDPCEGPRPCRVAFRLILLGQQSIRGTPVQPTITCRSVSSIYSFVDDILTCPIRFDSASISLFESGFVPEALAHKRAVRPWARACDHSLA